MDFQAVMGTYGAERYVHQQVGRSKDDPVGIPSCLTVGSRDLCCKSGDETILIIITSLLRNVATPSITIKQLD